MYLFIVNIKSGNGRGREVWSIVQKELSYYQISYQVEFTQRSGHAMEIAKKAIHYPNLKAIIAIGGDGTVHEVGNSMVDTGIPMGYIPAGTGNDYALANQICFDPVYALQRIFENKPYLIDTASLGERKMIGFLGIGFDGKIADSVNQSPRKRWIGRLAYGFEAIKSLKTYEPTRVSLTIDDQQIEYDNVWSIAVSNIPSYAGGMKVCPDASMNDGLLDICCVRETTRGQLIRMVPSIYKGKHGKHPFVSFHRGTNIQIDSGSPLSIHADGEIIGQTPLTVKVNPSSLLVL